MYTSKQVKGKQRESEIIHSVEGSKDGKRKKKNVW